jgi:hybrid polyketide synthase/nonribosomal peptide synthetase ACE1
MTLDEMEGALKPKIDGANLLNKLFYNTDLDFFILFSSLTSYIGNFGQTNYTAGCSYLTALASQRVNRGLAASSIDMGMVVGVGIMQRSGQWLGEQLAKLGYMPISESDLHQIFAEAVLAGQSQNGALCQVTTGLSALKRGQEKNPVPWVSDPRMSHRVIEWLENKDPQGDGKTGATPAAVRLETVGSKQEALEIIKGMNIILQIGQHGS